MNEYNCLKLGMKAPDFTAMSTFGPIRLSDFRGRWIVLFSHPGDFTPVCTTEFIAFAKENDSFIERNAQLLGLSIDSNPSHLAWVYNIYQNTGIQIPFPIISDRDMSISKLYGMIAPDVSTTETIRSVFIIDNKQIIRAILTYPLTNGRFIPEILRLLIALQTTDSEKVATPADWLPGEPVVIPAPNTYEELLSRIGGEDGYYCVDWYLCFKNI
jgi:peroxiredoxin (alkyl hydroperoxide reductase subunit C)